MKPSRNQSSKVVQSDGPFAVRAASNSNLTSLEFSSSFFFAVDPRVTTCTEGVFLPKFVFPTPANGARLQAEVNREMEFRVKAEATHATWVRTNATHWGHATSDHFKEQDHNCSLFTGLFKWFWGPRWQRQSEETQAMNLTSSGHHSQKTWDIIFQSALL